MIAASAAARTRRHAMQDFRWALIGPGPIAHKFAEAVQRLPGMQLVRVLGRDALRAQAFARRWAVQEQAVPAHGTELAALLADDTVDAVYIATPHAAHAEAIEACLRAGRPVLCEKPLVATASQARQVVALARERGVFLMEALWTRFLPLYTAMRPWLDDAAAGIGRVAAVQASFGFVTDYDAASRLWNPAAAGGTLLDIGIYPLAMARWALERAPGQCPALRGGGVTGALAPSGVDRRASAWLQFEGGAVLQFACGLDFVGDNTLRILGERGTVTVESPFWGGTRARLERPGEPALQLERPFAVNGFEYQLQEAVRCIRAGLAECPGMPLAESLALAEWLDAARREVGVVYPFD